MDVTSLVVALTLVGQTTTGDRYQNYTPPGGASLSTPTYSPSPASPGYQPLMGGSASPPAAPSSYPPTAVPPDPLFTAAAPKKTPAAPAASASSTPSSAPATTVTPIATPVPTSGSAVSSPPSVTSPPAASSPAPSDSSRAAELVREAIAIPAAVKIEGQSRTLYETLAPLGDRRAQLAAIVAYWRLAADTAEFHYDWQQAQFLEHLKKLTDGQSNDPATSAEVGARLATAQAQLRESELRLFDSQYELSQRSWDAGTSGRPLTVDLPHTGSYKTQFERLFGGASPSGRLVLLNRTLPLRQQVLNVRAESVWAAQNGYEQTFAAFQQSRLPAEEVLAALDDFRRRRSEFITAVRRYNEEIAEYALTSVSEGMTTATLLGMLLKNPAKPAANAVSADSTAAPYLDVDVAPATYVGPGPTPAPPLVAPSPDPISAAAASPTWAVPSPSTSNAAAASVTPATAFTSASDAAPLAPGSVPPPITAEMQRPPAQFGGALPVTGAPGLNPLRGQPTLAPPPISIGLPDAAASNAIVPATATNPYAPTSTNSMIPAVPSSPPTSAPPGLLPPFVPQQAQPAPLPQTRYRVHTTYFQSSATGGMTRAQATQELVESLYDSQGTTPNGTPISLDACLAKVAPYERSEVLATYWSAAEQQARRRVWAQIEETLSRVSPPSPRVQAASLAAEAERTEAAIALDNARLRLTEAVRHSHDEPWLLPETLPHGGRYDVKAEALAKRIASDPRLQRDVERIAALHETLQYRADAVTAIRTAAQSAVDRLASQSTTTHVALSAVERQARETCELLKTTTRYNLAIADYALGVLPATTPRDALVSALVVGRNAVASRP